MLRDLSDIESANDFPKPAFLDEVNSEISASDFLTISSALGVGEWLDYFLCEEWYLFEDLDSVPLLKGLNKSDTSVITSMFF